MWLLLNNTGNGLEENGLYDEDPVVCLHCYKLFSSAKNRPRSLAGDELVCISNCLNSRSSWQQIKRMLVVFQLCHLQFG